eukprot:gnl/Trimastix_PCT/497.p1 GENE.gnl/Trimastix_PCT/497~~gnl/Trimastix_PCT/497.p1  ORF type:complete len:270 (+),score=56.35 gnl/Trimastix_PCT/497:53-811(+)
MPLHVRANPEDIAPIVLLPGDPDRAKMLAETFLENPVLYNEYRHLLGYTGTYKGIRVSVQTTGMGCPSCSIVCEELIQLGAKVLIRVGTAGIISKNVKPCDQVIVMGSNRMEGTTRQYLGDMPYTPLADYDVLESLVRASREMLGCDPSKRLPETAHVGLIQSEDAFYATTPEHVAGLERVGVLAVEMESSALFTVAKMRGIKAGCVCTASNYIGDPEFVDPEKLREGVTRMLQIALDAAVLLTPLVAPADN